MDLFLSITDVLSQQIVSDWLTLVDITHLDKAYVSGDARRQFHKILSGQHNLAYFRSKNIHDQPIYLMWLGKRSILVKQAYIPSTVLSAMHLPSMGAFMQNCATSLEKVEFACCLHPEFPEVVISPILSKASNLLDLTLTIHWCISEEFLRTLSGTCPRLQKLTCLSGGTIQPFRYDPSSTWKFPSLQCITFTSGHQDGNFLQVLALATPQLSSLTLRRCECDDFCFSADTAKWTNLHTLRLLGTSLTNAFVKSMLRSNLHLHSLTINDQNDYTFNVLLSDKVLTGIARYCKNLGKLSLCIATATDEGMCAIARNCKNLSIVDISGCERCTESSMYNLFTNCPHLIDLNVRGCAVETVILLSFVVRLNCLKRVTVDINDDYGGKLDCLVSKARGQGIEVVLHNMMGW